jgi:hypothetical protein
VNVARYSIAAHWLRAIGNMQARKPPDEKFLTKVNFLEISAVMYPRSRYALERMFFPFIQ